jgi:hypothetical protein
VGLVGTPAVDEDGQPGMIIMLQPGDVYSMIEGYGLVPYWPCAVKESSEDVTQYFNVTLPLAGGDVTERLELDSSMDVLTLKAVIEQMSHIPVDQQRLMFSSKQLQDEDTLGMCGIKDGDTVTVMLRLVGAGKRARAGRDDKETVMHTIRRDILGSLAEIDVVDSPAVRAQGQTLRGIVDGNDKNVQKRLSDISVEDLKKLSAVCPTNNNEQKIRVFKSILLADLSVVTRDLKSLVATLESTSEAVTRFILSSDFMSEDGTMDWDALNTSIMNSIVEKANARNMRD